MSKKSGNITINIIHTGLKELSQNSKEVLENLNKFKKIGFGRSYDVKGLEANFRQENQICVEICSL